MNHDIFYTPLTARGVRDRRKRRPVVCYARCLAGYLLIKKPGSPFTAIRMTRAEFRLRMNARSQQLGKPCSHRLIYLWPLPHSHPSSLTHKQLPDRTAVAQRWARPRSIARTDSKKGESTRPKSRTDAGVRHSHLEKTCVSTRAETRPSFQLSTSV